MDHGHQPQLAGARSPGRPRLYEPGVERGRILMATLEVLRHGREVTVADILEKARLSTRAFYRHFETKEDVICAVYERDAESFGAHLWRRVESAADPGEALAIWVNEMLGLAYDRRRAERVSAMSSPMVARVVAGTATERLGAESLVAPLRSVLDEGLRAGWFPDAQVGLDVHTIRAIAMEVIGWARTGGIRLARRKAADHILRFSLAALGAPNPDSP